MPAAGLSQRLLSVLQLTRMALVFTAIADSAASLLLLAASRLSSGERLSDFLTIPRVLATAMVSIGLYGFGMSLNDIIDRRRDTQIASHRPLPSGRISLISAHVICILLGLSALLAGGYLAHVAETRETRTMTVALLLFTGMLITFYDFAGKYLVAPGLLTLGLIRFFHATIPAPQLPLLWHPLLLMNHVAILSLVAYAWEQKRPALSRIHWWAVLGGLTIADTMCIAMVWWRRSARLGDAGFVQSLWITPGLYLPAGAIVAFVVGAAIIRKQAGDSRGAGQALMLFGLLWLIVYDVCFVAGYVGIFPAILLLLLLPAAYVSVQLMRWWGRLLALSHRPEYQRAR